MAFNPGPQLPQPPAGLRAAPLAAERGSAMQSATAVDRWWLAAGLIAAAALLFGLLFHHDMAGAVRVWIESTAYNHCFLILPLVGFLLWDRRAIIAGTVPAPNFWPLLLMPLLSAVWLVAAVLDINEGRQLAVVAMFEIVLLVTLGPALFRKLLAPLLFLFFLVPTGAFLVPSLQTITAKIVVAGLHALHIPVFSDGYMIQIPEGSFEIAEACAGLRFLIASTVFGCFFAVVMYRSLLSRALFIILSLSVPIGANGMRALGIIYLAHLEGSATAVEADHIIYGWLFFSLVILLLIALGMSFVDKGARPTPPPDPLAPRLPRWRFVGTVVVAVLLAAAGPAYAARLDSWFSAAALPATVGPPAIAPAWRAVAAGGIGWRPVVYGANRQFLQSYTTPGAAPGTGVVVRYVALYRLRAVGNALTNTDNRVADDHAWRIALQMPAETRVNGAAAPVTSTQIVSGPHRRLVWSFYVVDGKISGGLLRTKLLQARAVLLRHSPFAAFVAISASMDDPSDPAPAQLKRFLQASQSIPQYLDELAGPAPGAAGAIRAQPATAG
ncbi:MAG: exosortase A [Stellaceae bacterium]